MAPAPLRRRAAAPRPAAPARPARPPPSDTAWTRVTVTGRYDPRTRSWSAAGRSTAGSASRCSPRWCSPTARPCWWTGAGSRRRRVAATAQPPVPAAPTGDVTVVGRVHQTESRRRRRWTGATAGWRPGGSRSSRLAGELPYPVYGAYLLLDEQTPAADPAFKAVPIGHANNWQNFGYVVQWWLFAGMALFGYGWVARREARRLAGGTRRHRRDRTAGSARDRRHCRRSTPDRFRRSTSARSAGHAAGVDGADRVDGVGLGRGLSSR